MTILKKICHFFGKIETNKEQEQNTNKLFIRYNEKNIKRVKHFINASDSVLGQNRTEIFFQSTRSIVSFLHNCTALSCSFYFACVYTDMYIRYIQRVNTLLNIARNRFESMYTHEKLILSVISYFSDPRRFTFDPRFFTFYPPRFFTLDLRPSTCDPRPKGRLVLHLRQFPQCFRSLMQGSRRHPLAQF